jgi:transcriptional regulator with XRE-family HTH domain
MTSDQGPVVSSALLRSELVRRRREKKLTQEQVAGRLEWSSSKLIRIEGGRSGISKVDLDALLDIYGVTAPDQREQLQGLNRGSRQRGWWDDHRADLSPVFVDYLGYEAGASFIRGYQSVLLPGMVHNRGYAHAVAAATLEDPRGADTAVAIRMLRQQEKARRTPPPFELYLVDEAAIRRRVGMPADPTVMPGQLRELAARIKDDERLTVRVIPFTVGAHMGLTGPFILLEFESGLPDILYIDMGKNGISMVAGDEPRVARYRDAFETLLDQALSAGESIDLMLAAADEMS